jgi:signal transduction histidine kinase
MMTERIPGSALPTAKDESKSDPAPGEHAQHLATLGNFAAGVVHDLRALLLPMSGGIESPDVHPATAEAGRRARAVRIIEAAELARDLSDQILEFARGAAYECRPLSLGSVVSRVLPLLRAALPVPVELRAALDRDTPLIRGNAVGLQRALLNLVLNAARALPDRHGVIEIGVVGLSAASRSRPVQLEPAAPASGALDVVRLTVADNGIGMDAARLNNLLTSLFATGPRPPGVGLGLGIVNSVVRLHLARLSIASEPRIGTTVRIDFPVVAPGDAPAEPPA